MIKYRLPYKSYDESDWLLTIDIPSYTGDPITISGVEGKSAILRYDGGVDDQWDSTLVNTILTSEVYNEDNIDITELQLVEDRTVIVTLTRNNDIKFKGWLISDGMQGNFTKSTHSIILTATSGLNLLKGITFSGVDNSLGLRTPLNFFRRILHASSNLGIQLPIRWTETVSQEYTLILDAFEYSIWSANGQGFYYLNIKTGVRTYVDCEYIIKGFAQALKCRVIQCDGAWWILGIKESLSDYINFKECANYTGNPVITESNISALKNIGSDYISIYDDSVLTVLPALKAANVVYDHKQRKNIIPNGGQDEWSLGSPLYWMGETGLLYSQDNDITGQGGYSVELNNLDNVEKKYYLNGALPIDANILYKKLTWGFSFVPLSGFPVDENGFIKWENNQIKTSIKYTVDIGGVATDYYLNEFGYWGNKNSPANAQVTNVSFVSLSGLYIYFDASKNFYIGDEVVIIFRRSGQTERYSIVFNETMDVESGINYIVTKIPNSSNPISPANALNILNVTDNPINNAYTQKTNDYYKYIYFSVDKLKLDDAAAVSYRGASNFDMFIVDPGDLGISGISGIGRLSIEFYIKPNQKMLLDNVWMNIEENQDLYEVTNPSTNNANVKDVTLNISSAFSGFYESNFMRSYNTSDVDWKFSDGVNTGSLTELFARSMMRSRYKPSFIFNGTISTRGKDWSFLDNYTINGLEGKKFIPLNPSYNTSKNEVSLVCVEDRSDNIAMNVIHKGKNDEVND